MPRKLCDLLADLDVRIEKRAQAKSMPAPATSEDDAEIKKLAQDFVDATPEPEETIQLTETEKIAHSMAVLETILGGEELAKLVEFEKTATERGVPRGQLQEAITKYANRTQTGERIIQFMRGMGSGTADVVEGFGKQLPKSTNTEIAGNIAGKAAPLVGIGGLGMYLGSKAKERQIRRKMGIQ